MKSENRRKEEDEEKMRRSTYIFTRKPFHMRTLSVASANLGSTDGCD
jgi:hypothetical protein